MSNELYHFGIKGQKWGVRRFQNSDGTLTPAGRKRYVDEKTKGVQKDIDSFAPYRKTGIKARDGKLVMSPKEVDDIVKALEQAKDKIATKYGEKYDRVAKKQNEKASKLADQKWNEAKKEYANTGRNFVQRVINNVKYGD